MSGVLHRIVTALTSIGGVFQNEHPVSRNKSSRHISAKLICMKN